MWWAFSAAVTCATWAGVANTFVLGRPPGGGSPGRLTVMRTLRSCFQCELELAVLELAVDELAAVELAPEELLPDELALDELPPQPASASAAPRTARANRIGGLCM